MEETTERIEVAGAAIGVRRLGDGPPLVVINGYAATNLDWDPTFLAALARAPGLICPDNRGVGSSTATGGPTEVSADSMAADVLAVMDALGISSAPVLGWSMGGFVAQAIALAAPERVEALILLATDPGAGAELCDGATWRRLIDHGGTPREQASRLISLLFPPGVAEPIDSEFGEIVAAARAQLDHGSLSAQETAMRSWHDDRDRSALASISTLAATGTLDVVIPPVNAELIADRSEESWLARFPGCGHAFMAQEPERLAALIATFLGR